MKKKMFYFTYQPVNRYGKVFSHEIEVVGVSFLSKKKALRWLQEQASVLARSVFHQFKDQLDYISGFKLYLYKDKKVVMDFIMREYQD